MCLFIDLQRLEACTYYQNLHYAFSLGQLEQLGKNDIIARVP